MGRLLSGRTVGVRFTLLYAAVFLTSGIGLLALTNLFAAGNSSEVVPAPGQAGGAGDAASRQHIAFLEAQLAELEAEQTRTLLTASLVALVVMAAVSIALGRAVSAQVLRPLRTITAATQRITAENLHERLGAPGPDDEVKDLADTIDGLLERLEASFGAQRTFVANASHELRTPLTTMRASLDVAAAKPDATAQTIALAGRVRAELDQVDRLLRGLLVLARAQHGVLTDRAPVPLARIVREALAVRAADATAKALAVDDSGLWDDAVVDGEPTLLTRMTQNLVDNAVAHNTVGGRVRVATATWENTVRLTVETDGPVLDQARVDRLTEPFHRLGTERTGSDGGSGLGLSIVAAVAASHGGRLELHARREGGLRVTVTLPTAAAPAPRGVPA